MKQPIWLIVILLCAFAFFVSCNKETATNNGTFNIKLGECASLDKNITICLDSLIEDSRCPLDVVCNWQGIAIAKFSFHQNNVVTPFTLANWQFRPYNQDTTINQIKISLQDITPYPIFNNPSKDPVNAIIKIN